MTARGRSTASSARGRRVGGGRVPGGAPQRKGRQEARTPSGPGARRPAWKETAAAAAALAMAIGAYIWLLRHPSPALMPRGGEPAADPVQGLAEALATGLLAGVLVVGALGAVPKARAWRGRAALAAGGLYLSALLSALGPAALYVGPLAAIGVLAAIAIAGRSVEADALLVFLHAGSLGTALAFFHQWPRYREGWEPFLENLSALASLWF